MSLFSGGGFHQPFREVLHEPIRGGFFYIPSSPPDSILNLCVVPFPSGRVRDGVPQWEGGYGGKGQLEISPMGRSKTPPCG